MSDTERRKEQRVMDRGEERRRGPDALRTNPEVMERHDPEAERSNPEVMGRSEPQTMTATTPRQTEMASEMAHVRMKFDQLQSEFIEDPQRAAKKAQQLLEDVFSKMHEKLQNTHREVEKSHDTEQLRLAMRSYRDILDSFGGHRTV